MADLLTNFDSDKKELGSRIETAESIETAVKLMDEYLFRLHRNMTGPLQKTRHAGYLIEIARYAARMLNTVDAVVRLPESRPSDARPEQASKGVLVFGKAVQSAILLALLMALLPLDPAPWIPILLVIILLGMDIYLHVHEWRTRSVSGKSAGIRAPWDIAAVQLKIVHVHAFLNCLADALSCIDKALDEQGPENDGDFLEKETQVLKLFQDLLEAKAFQDGEWALKKAGHIQAILWERGIVVKEFDPGDAADSLFFDVEPGADPSISRHVTIRPAFIKGNRALLRGRAAAPFSSRIIQPDGNRP